MGTVIVAAMILLAAVMAIRSMVQRRKNGKAITCGGDCSRCSGHCH